MPQPETLLTSAQAAKFLSVAPKTIANWRTRKQGPPYCRIGRLARYQMSALMKWLAATAVRPAAPANDSIGNR
jgi:predicted DNA-binding transcriptional regulator AlpA